MPKKTRYSGPIISGHNLGAPSLNTLGQATFSVLTTVTTTPVTSQVVAVLPPDAVLQSINLIHRATIVGEAVQRFGTVAGGSDNLGLVTLSAAGRYSAYVDSATALTTTLPMGKTPVSGETTIYLSTGTTSGSLVSLQGNLLIDVVYTRKDLALRDDARTIPNKLDLATHFQGPIRAGRDHGMADAMTEFSYGRFVQHTTVAASPTTAQFVGTLPHGARLEQINFYVGAASAGEATARAEIGSATGASNLGSVSLSGAAKYSINALASLTASPLIYGFNNSGTAFPIYVSLVAASGVISALSAKTVAELVYTRFDGDRGMSTIYGGAVNGLKATGFLNGLSSGVNQGLNTRKQRVGWMRFVQTTTVTPSTAGGVVSSARVAVLPTGWALLDTRLFLRNTLGGEARVRFTTRNDFAASDLASISVSGAGEYSVNTATAANEIAGMVNMGSAQSLYISMLALSGSISNLTANPALIQITMAKMDPDEYGGM